MKIYSKHSKSNNRYFRLYCPFCKAEVNKETIDENDIEKNKHYKSIVVTCSKCSERFIKIIPYLK